MIAGGATLPYSFNFPMANAHTFIPAELSDRKATKLPLALIDTGDTTHSQPVYAIAVSTALTADAVMWISGETGTKVALGLVALGTSPETYAIMVSE